MKKIYLPILLLITCFSLKAEKKPKNFTGTIVNVRVKGAKYETNKVVYGLKNAIKLIGNDYSRISCTAQCLNGKKNGPEIDWQNYSKGHMNAIKLYNNGKLEGTSITFFSNGKIMAKGINKDGEHWQGTFRVFWAKQNEDGTHYIAGFLIVTYNRGIRDKESDYYISFSQQKDSSNSASTTSETE